MGVWVSIKSAAAALAQVVLAAAAAALTPQQVKVAQQDSARLAKVITALLACR
jgi:hypothetical protein